MKHKSSCYGLLAVSVSALLAGCGWFSGDAAAPAVKARPGADRMVAPSAALPPPEPGHRFERDVTPADETRGTAPGSVVGAKGGQRAQKEAIEKDIADRDAKEREARAAAEREAKARQQSEPLEKAPADAPPAAAPATSEPAPAAPKS